MRILITSTLDPLNSPHNRLHQYVKYLSKNHRVTIVCIHDSWKKKQIDSEDTYCKDAISKSDLIYMTKRKMSPILQEVISPLFIRISGDFDVHLNYGALVSGYYVAKREMLMGTPTILDIADDNIDMIRNSPQIPKPLRSFGAFIGNYFNKKNIEIAERVTISALTLKETYDIPDEKTVLIPNGVDTDLFKLIDSDREKFNLDGSFVIGYVGVLREWVDLEPVFLALKRLANIMNIRMLIVGKEGGFDETRKLAKNCMVEEIVVFTGNVNYNKVPEYIAMMDACVIPFKNNSVAKNALPLKLFEYMSCGKPVITSRLINVMSTVGNSVLYADNTEEYVDMIRYLYRNNEMAKELSLNGINVSKSYSWDANVNKLNKILMEIKK